jgi:hypothetical protein
MAGNPSHPLCGWSLTLPTRSFALSLEPCALRHQLLGAARSQRPATRNEFPVPRILLFLKSSAQDYPCRRSICAADFQRKTDNFIFTGRDVNRSYQRFQCDLINRGTVVNEMGRWVHLGAQVGAHGDGRQVEAVAGPYPGYGLFLKGGSPGKTVIFSWMARVAS